MHKRAGCSLASQVSPGLFAEPQAQVMHISPVVRRPDWKPPLPCSAYVRCFPSTHPLGIVHQVEALHELIRCEAPLIPCHDSPDVLEDALGQAPLHKRPKAVSTLQQSSSSSDENIQRGLPSNAWFELTSKAAGDKGVTASQALQVGT